MREDKVSIVRACRIVELDRSMFYYQSVKDDSEVEAKLSSYVESKLLCNRGCPEYYKRLRREGFPWNRKRVERIYRNMGLSKRRKKKSLLCMIYLLIIHSLLSFSSFDNTAKFEYQMGSDTTIVGRVVDTDSIFHNSNFQYHGIKYYYGVHHLKIVLIDVARSNKTTDTLILAYVYNKITELELYKRNFDLIRGKNYIFYVHSFRPCQSDFPRIQGICSDDGKSFYPESNKLVKCYKSINRIIFFTGYRQ